MKWDELDDVIKDLHSMKIPEGPFKLDKATTITNTQGFVNSHISICLGFKGNTLYLPYLDRLIKFRNLIKNQ